MATGGSDRVARLWDADTGKLRHTLKGHRATVSSVAFSHDGDLLFTGGVDDVVGAWDPSAGKLTTVLYGHPWNVTAVATGRKTLALASGSSDGSVLIWNTETGKPSTTLAHGKAVWALAFSPDDTRIASAGRGEGEVANVVLWDAATGKRLAEGRGGAGTFWGVAYSPDGRTLATAGDDGVVQLWAIGP